MKTTYILGAITIAEIYFTKGMIGSIFLWICYGAYVVDYKNDN